MVKNFNLTLRNTSNNIYKMFIMFLIYTHCFNAVEKYKKVHGQIINA
jgi:hypothetical protein